MKNAIEVWADNNRAKIEELLPEHVSKERFVRNMVFQVANNPAVAACDQRSIVESCIQATLHGLDIGVLGSCYLVPFQGKAKLIIGYQGLLDLARRAGSLSSVHVETVHEADSYSRTAREFIHTWDPFKDRGALIGAYSIMVLKDGSEQVETMSKVQIDSIRDRSRAGNRGPWVTDYEEMAKKTVLRRALKKMKLSVDVQEALVSDDSAAYEQTEVQVREKPKKSRTKLLEATNYEPPRAGDRVVPETGEEDIPIPPEEAKASDPKPPSTPKSRSRDWEYDRTRANHINKRLGFSRWDKMTSARQRLVIHRQREEETESPADFWDLVESTLVRTDPRYWSDWSVCTLETLIRTSVRGGTDHFQRLKEGYAPPAEREPSQVNKSQGDGMSDGMRELWDEAV